MNQWRSPWLMIFACLLLVGLSTGGAGRTAWAADHPDGSRETTLHWEEVEGAATYELDLRRVGAAGSEPVHGDGVKVKETTFKAWLMPGKYELRLRTFDRRSVPGVWSDFEGFTVKPMVVIPLAPKRGAVIATKDAVESPMTFMWKESPGVAKYRVDVLDEAGAKIGGETVQAAEWKMTLKVACRYAWSVTGITADGIEGDAMASPRPFAVLGGPLERPVISFKPGEPPAGASWTMPPNADKIDAKLQIRAVGTRQWKTMKSVKDATDREFALDPKWPSGRLRVSVRAKGVMRGTSDWAVEELDYKMSSVVEQVLQTQRGRIVGGYAPLYTRYTLAGKRVQEFSFDAVLTSSYFVSAQWWVTKSRRFGLDLFWHRARTTLFDTKKTGTDASTNQQPVPVEISEISGGGRYRVWESPWTLDIKAGVARRAAMTFYVGSSNALQAASNSVTEFILGTMVAKELVFGVSTVGDVDMGWSIGSSGMTVKSCRHVRLSVGLTRHMFFIPQILLGVHYQLDNTEYDFTDEARGLVGTMTTQYHRLMGSVGLIF